MLLGRTTTGYDVIVLLAFTALSCLHVAYSSPSKTNTTESELINQENNISHFTQNSQSQPQQQQLSTQLGVRPTSVKHKKHVNGQAEPELPLDAHQMSSLHQVVGDIIGFRTDAPPTLVNDPSRSTALKRPYSLLPVATPSESRGGPSIGGGGGSMAPRYMRRLFEQYQDGRWEGDGDEGGSADTIRNINAELGEWD